MRSHVSRTVCTCFAALWQTRSIRHCIRRQALLSLMVSLVLSRLSYGSATLAALPPHFISRLQSVMNAAARLIFLSWKYDHMMPLLHQLHWLKMEQQIEYKLAVLVYCWLCGLALCYFVNDLQRISDIDSWRQLRWSLTDTVFLARMRLSTVVLSQSLQLGHGTICWMQSRHVLCSPCSNVVWKLYRFPEAILMDCVSQTLFFSTRSSFCFSTSITFVRCPSSHWHHATLIYII